jgi:hypothetical protein
MLRNEIIANCSESHLKTNSVSGMQNLSILNWWCRRIRRANNQIYILLKSLVLKHIEKQSFEGLTRRRVRNVGGHWQNKFTGNSVGHVQ